MRCLMMGMVVVLASALPVGSDAVSRKDFDALDKRVRQCEADIILLKSKGKRTATAEGKGEAPKLAKHMDSGTRAWLALRVGLSERAVRDLLGEPTIVIHTGTGNVLFYGHARWPKALRSRREITGVSRPRVPKRTTIVLNGQVGIIIFNDKGALEYWRAP